MNNIMLFNFLNELGLSKEEARLFEILVKKGAQTILELSRETGINRTRVYRLLDRLKKQGFVEELVEENKQLVKASGLNQLDLSVKQHESKATFLRDVFPAISSFISSSLETVQPGTRVIFHRGAEGIKQMVWNVLSAKKECVGYTYREIDEVVGKKFSREWREEFIVRGLKFRDIYSDHYLESKKKIQRKPHPLDKKHFEGRYLSAKVLEVNHQVDIYNDVVAYYNWFEGEVFGVEIYNQKIATMQKQLFELVWKIAKEPKKLKS